MILLDTNHLTVVRYPEDQRHERLIDRMRSSIDQDFVIPIVAVEEQMRGWLAVIHKARDPRRQVNAYDRLASMIDVAKTTRNITDKIVGLLDAQRFLNTK